MVGWLQSANKGNNSNAPVQRPRFSVSGIINGFYKIRQLLENSNLPIVFTNISRWRQKVDPVHAEILFGQAEGRPWLDMP